jgi:hypothetical protein
VPIPRRPFASMVSDANLSGKRCSKRGGECGAKEQCALWIHNHDDREGCVADSQCNTFGRLVNEETRGEASREWFTITCHSDNADWIKKAYEFHEK